MATTALLGQGTKLERHTGTARITTTPEVAQVQSITGPTQSADLVDVTNHQSSGSYREFIAGLRDGGELTFDLVFDPANTSQSQLQTDFEAGTLLYWRIEFNNPGTMGTGTLWDFDGIVTGYSLSIPTDDAVKASCTIKVTGGMTITAAV